jgi:uncharacterized protein (DUF2141 family)
MSKVRIAAMVLALGLMPVAGRAAPVGPDAAACTAGRSAMLVRITGFKTRTGTIRVQSYGGDPDSYFDKGSYLQRVEAKVPAAGPLEVCMAVPAPGRYAVSVRHDVDGSGRTSRADGGGMSGNPHLSLLDVMLKRKPSPDEVAVPVGHGVRVVPITLNYLTGGGFGPVTAAG